MKRLKIGTKVRTLYDHSETGTVTRHIKKIHGDLPNDLDGQWHLIRFDRDGKLGTIHRNMLAISNG
jgi:hypothetical protein